VVAGAGIGAVLIQFLILALFFLNKVDIEKNMS
jgi:hypothetical protein